MKFNNDNQNIFDYLVREVGESNENIESVMVVTENNEKYLEVICNIKNHMHTLKFNLAEYLIFLNDSRYDKEVVIKDIVDDVNHRMDLLEYSDVDLDITSFDEIRDRIAFTIMSVKNEALLKEVPHLVQLDMAIYFYVAVDILEDSITYITINNEIVKKWNVSLETIISVAVVNTSRLLPVDILQISDEDEEYDSEFFLYGVEPVIKRDVFLLTNKSATQGACVMLYPHVLENLSNEIGDDLILLPTTVHEVLVIKSSYTEDKEFLSKIMRTLAEFNIDVLDSCALNMRPYIFERNTNKLRFLERR